MHSEYWNWGVYMNQCIVVPVPSSDKWEGLVSGKASSVLKIQINKAYHTIYCDEDQLKKEN